MARISAMFSGSKGNSTFISAGGQGILIDAGVSATAIVKALRDRAFNVEDICAILITHEHSDHIRGISLLSRKFRIPVYANRETLLAAQKQGMAVSPELVRELPVGEGLELEEMKIISFETPHDAARSVGYRIELPDGRKVGVATDIGYISDEVKEGLTGCEFVLLESNHDVAMLRSSTYPYFLKQRILGEFGHLSNVNSAKLVADLAQNGSARFILGHLSKENNRPEIAYHEVVSALSEQGLRINSDYLLDVVAQGMCGKVHIF